MENDIVDAAEELDNLQANRTAEQPSEPVPNAPVPETVPNVNEYLTTVASIAAIIDLTHTVITNMSGEGLELVNSDGGTMSSDELHDLVSSYTNRAINDKAVSFDVMNKGAEYV